MEGVEDLEDEVDDELPTLWGWRTALNFVVDLLNNRIIEIL